jgi:hypothetical protein
VDLLSPALSYCYDRPNGLSRSQREVLAGFLQSCQDWGDIVNDIGPQGHFDAGQSLDEGLEDLRAEGLVVYATTRRLTLKVGADSSPWLEAVVKVVHARDAAVAVTPGGDE